MKNRYPESVEIDGDKYELERVLKEDFFSVNGLYINKEGRRYVLKVSDFRFLCGFLFRPLAIFCSRHEHHMYTILQDIPGAPKAGPRVGRRGFLHEFVEGKTLFDVEEENLTLPDGFFDELLVIVEAIHDRYVIYLDLNKRGNIILGTDNKPHLIDFQISINFRGFGFLMGWLKRPLFRTLAREDIYHVYKHKRNMTPDQMREHEWELSHRSKANARMARLIGDPYRKLKRKIYPSESNDTVWYKWRKERHAQRRTTD